MQAAEMLRGTRAYVYHLVFLISLSVGYVHPFPLQVLPSIPGYIPVYIRHGDQPLEEINPALAEAFHEGSSLSKISLGNVHDLTDISLEEDEANKNHVEAVHIRQVDNNFSTEDETSKKPTGLASKTETLKRKAISKPVLKVTPLTEEEKKDLEALKVKIKETKNSSSKHDSSTKSPELSSDKPHHGENLRKFNPVVKVDQIVTDESVKPDLYLIKDILQSSKDEDAPASTHMDEDTPASKHKDESPPVKVQHHPNVYNVHKLDISPEILLQLKERTENQSLEEKSK